jgi:hypothetical protein
MFDFLSGLRSNDQSALVNSEKAANAPGSKGFGLSEKDRKAMAVQFLAKGLMQAGQTTPMQGTGYVPMNNGQFAAGGQLVGGR